MFQNGFHPNFYSNDQLSTYTEKPKFDFNRHWSKNEDITNIHLMAISTLCNTIMSLSEEVIGGNEERQCWSNLMTLHCALLPGKVEHIFAVYIGSAYTEL